MAEAKRPTSTGACGGEDGVHESGRRTQNSSRKIEESHPSYTVKLLILCVLVLAGCSREPSVDELNAKEQERLAREAVEAGATDR